MPKSIGASSDLINLVSTVAAAGNPQAAAAAASGSIDKQGDDSSSEDVEFVLDQLHLMMMRNVCGPPPAQVRPIKQSFLSVTHSPPML